MATWVVGDVHGCYDDFMKLLDHKEVDPKDKFILIGDIIDRGPDSYKMIRWAMKHISKTGKYQMILGNHEDNIIQDFNKCQLKLERGWYNRNGWCDTIYTLEDLDISALNTHYDFIEYMYAEGFESVESVRPIVDWFKTLPLTKKVTVTGPDGNKLHYLLAHGWWRPGIGREMILWYRDISEASSPYDTEKDQYKPVKDEVLIHGHTPTIILRNKNGKPYNKVLIKKNSINIDCGCVFKKFGGRLAAIRLEDKKIIYV